MNPSHSYRESAARGATPMQLVVLLYEQILTDLRRALEALDCGEVEARTRHLNHAILVLAHLQTSLNREQGGSVARHLDAFYNLARSRLTEAHCKSSPEILHEQLLHFSEVRTAWMHAERAERRLERAQ